MCDYSLQSMKTRPATVADKLKTHAFGTGTTGFTDADYGGPASEATAVCVIPGTELAFDEPVKSYGVVHGHTTAIFRQLHKEHVRMHHDTLEFPDGMQATLSSLSLGQYATVLQLPAAPRNEVEREEQRRVEVVG